jgi:hypothetical protein
MNNLIVAIVIIIINVIFIVIFLHYATKYCVHNFFLICE